MSLRPPDTLAQRTPVALQFPGAASAAEARRLGGARFEICFDDGRSVPVVVLAVVGDVLDARVGADDAGELAGAAGQPVTVRWTELDDIAAVSAVIDARGDGAWTVDCAWPPQRVQRREFRRAAVDLPLWIVRLGPLPTVAQGATRDLSGTGVSARIDAADLAVDQRIVVVLRTGERDVCSSAIVQWVRQEHGLVGAHFECLSARDQDLLVGVVGRAEVARG